ncbi:hypothetical protein BGZ76_000445 [Entomortierella beljakovae]|nr:hypothetical protein BGZ76_000445 [Entomortierella beljakovae]
MNSSSSSSSSENKPGHRLGVVHSTHAHLETFDQVTREQGISLDIKGDSNSNTTSSSKSVPWHHPSSEKEANSAVQLDRDMHESRRMSDSDRQKATGNSRSSSYSNNMSYVE